MHFLRYLSLGLVAAALPSGVLRSSPRVEPLPDLLIGYTEFRTDLPGGHYVNDATMRAVVVKADGTGRRVLAEELTREGLLDAVRRLVARREGGQGEPLLEE